MASRYADATRRLFGEDLQLGTFAPELAAGITFQQDRPEWHYPLGSRLWSSGPVTVAAAAGNRGKVEIPNLTTSLIIVVTGAGVLGASTAGDIFFLTMDGPPQGAPAQNFARDSRQQGLLVQSVSRLGNAAGGVGGNQLDRVTANIINADYDFKHGLPVIIHPGHNVQIWANTVNTLLTAIFVGYEYNARPEELAS